MAIVLGAVDARGSCPELRPSGRRAGAAGDAVLSENYERWMRNGAKGTAARETELYQKKLDEYEQPPLDDAIRQDLEEYVVRRRAELGD